MLPRSAVPLPNSNQRRNKFAPMSVSPTEYVIAQA
jgi:hypothetical protein